MTAQETIIKYLRGRKTGATVPEILAGTGLNANTVRRIVGAWEYQLARPFYYRRGRGIKLPLAHKCRVTGKILSAYGVQS